MTERHSFCFDICTHQHHRRHAAVVVSVQHVDEGASEEEQNRHYNTHATVMKYVSLLTLLNSSAPAITSLHYTQTAT